MTTPPHCEQLHPADPPRFGEADLSNCEREQIHLAGAIQPHGALLVVTEPELVIVQASANAPVFLRLWGPLLGLPLSALGGNLATRVRSRLSEPLDILPVAVRCEVASLDVALDGSLHRPPGGGLVVELELAAPACDLKGFVQDALKAISRAFSLPALGDTAARIFKDLTGYDRVMVYQFDDEGHGTVIAEARQPEQVPYLGNRYPASDIPQIARRLYERNRLRFLRDVDDRPVPLEPPLAPFQHAPLDMSLCCLRGMSPIHIQYLRNMGVRASLSTSMMVNGRLWGLVLCHHDSPHLVQYPIRVVCALLAEAIATRITALDGFAQSRAELAVRHLGERMILAVATQGAWERALFDYPEELLQALRANGLALLRDDGVLTAGEVPGLPELQAIGAWLDQQASPSFTATHNLAQREPGFAGLLPGAAGVLAVPLSFGPGEYLLWFRPERVRTLTWGGNPHEATKEGADPRDISPRLSFARWQEEVKGTADPWTHQDLTIARQIGNVVADVMQEIRSIRLLITQHQVKEFSARLYLTEHPLVVADATQRIILLNQACAGLLPSGQRPTYLTDLLPLLHDQPEASAGIMGALEELYPWRGEVVIRLPNGQARPFLLRLDPVVSAHDSHLGYVLVGNDLSDLKAAEVARRQFQDSLSAEARLLLVPADLETDHLFHDLLADILGNAQLAAREVRNTLEVGQVPTILCNLHTSVVRTTELLEHLMWYEASGVANTSRLPPCH